MWTRHGECNNCGFCCQMFARRGEVRSSDQGDQAFYQARGFQPVTIDGTKRLLLMGWMAAPCPQHVDSACAIYATRPETCRDFPTLPVDVVATPCSYYFEQDGVKVGGDASPHPWKLADWVAHEQGAA